MRLQRQSHPRHRQHDRHRRGDCPPRASPKARGRDSRPRRGARPGARRRAGRIAPRSRSPIWPIRPRRRRSSTRPSTRSAGSTRIVNNAASVARSDLAQHRRRVLRPDDGRQRACAAAADPGGLSASEAVAGLRAQHRLDQRLQGESNLLAYSISKGALMTLSRNLADALCYDQIRVNHFNVGWVLTPNEYKQKIADGLPTDWPEHVEPQFAPSGRIMTPEEIAAAAVYWLSRREPADQRQRGGAGAVSRSSAAIRRSEATDAATGCVSQGVHGRAVRRRHDDDPRVDRAGGDARHRRAGVLHAVSRAAASRRVAASRGEWPPTMAWRSRCSAARPISRIPMPRFAQQQIEQQKSWIDMCAELGGQYCRVLSGQRRPEVSRDDGLALRGRLHRSLPAACGRSAA